MLYEQVQEAVAAVRQRSGLQPAIALILGSGLGGLVDAIEDAVAIPYELISHFARSTIEGHVGRLFLGHIEGQAVVVMQGRFHFYEGHSPQLLTLPMRVMAMLGARTLIVSNAAGGVNPAYRVGDFMLIQDHIFLPGLAGAHPLLGPHDERFGDRFQSLANVYDCELRSIAQQVATDHEQVRLHEGVYTMVSGPSYETPAELRFLRMIGTDAVGMSTVPEVVVARQMGMRVLGLSLITNQAMGEEKPNVNELSHQEVLSAADAASVHFTAFVRGIVRALGPH